MNALAALLAATVAAGHAGPEVDSTPPDIVDVADQNGSFTTLVAALEAADLVGALRGDGPFTVFAPTDAAFAQLPEGTVESLLEPANRSKLVEILTYHVVPRRVLAAQAAGSEDAATLSAGRVRFSIREGRLFVNEAAVVANDIEAANGVIHVLDSVLLSEAPKGRLVVGIYTSEVSSALAAQLGIDRSAALLVSRLTKGGNAASAGLERYDVITEIDGEAATEESLSEAKRNRGYLGTVAFTVLRRGEVLHVEVPVGIDPH